MLKVNIHRKLYTYIVLYFSEIKALKPFSETWITGNVKLFEILIDLG